MTVTKRHGSTVFDRVNFTVLDVTELSDPIPVMYEPEDLFALYQFIFNVNLNSSEFETSTPFSLLLTVSSFLQGTGDGPIDYLKATTQTRLREFLATPVIIYSDAWLGLPISEPDMGKTLALATASYRVQPLKPRI
jgi:hypothetical protein